MGGIVDAPAGTWAYDKASKRLSLNSTMCVASVSAGPGPSPGPGPGDPPETWYKPLPGKAAAVALFNRGAVNASMSVSFSDLPSLGSGVHTCVVDDVWDHTQQ